MRPIHINYLANSLALSFSLTQGDAAAPAPDSVTWDFGDGTTGTGTTASHTYANGGSFVVTADVQYTDSGRVTHAKGSRRVDVMNDYVDQFGIHVSGVSPEWVARVKGGLSATPAPVLSSISPTTAVHGAADVTVTCTGTGFQPASVVRWGTVPKTVTFVSKTSITFTAPVAASAASTVSVTVANPDGRVSGGQNFTLT